MVMLTKYSKNKETEVVSGFCSCWLLAGACGPWARKWAPPILTILELASTNVTIALKNKSLKLSTLYIVC